MFYLDFSWLFLVFMTLAVLLDITYHIAFIIGQCMKEGLNNYTLRTKYYKVRVMSCTKIRGVENIHLLHNVEVDDTVGKMVNVK